MIYFLYGSDAKSRNAALLSHLKEHAERGEDAVLLVPEQETVTLERRVVEELPPSAQLNIEVSNFTRLSNRIFRHLGGLSCRYATPAAKALVMWQSLRRIAPMLKQYGTHAGSDLRLCERMLTTVSQFKAYCVDAKVLGDGAERLAEGDPLKAKLSDLALIMATYQGELCARYDDAESDLARAATLLGEHRELFSSTHFYISSFTDFTGQELALIKMLMSICPTLTIALPLDGRGVEEIHLSAARTTERRLVSMAKDLGLRIFDKKLPSEKPKTALQYLRRDLFDLDAEAAPMGLAESGEITLTVADNPYREAEYAANLIARAVREGAHYRDFTVVLRDATAHVGIIDAALEKEGIPFYLSEKTDITVRPLIKLLLFALRIQRYHWQKEDVVGYLKTGLTGVDVNDVNFFEEYAEVWHVCGKKAFETPFTMNADGYTERTSARAARILEGANRARAALAPPLTQYFEELENARSATQMAEATYRFLAVLGVPEAMKARAAAHLMAGERREAEESTRLWGTVVDALETLATVLGDEVLDTAAFSDALSLLFGTTDIGTIPTSADEVLIGSAATLRAAPSRYAVVMGLNDGLFPKVTSETGLLSDAEKRRLADFGIELSSDLATAASNELFYVHRALSLPEEKLYLSYTKSGGDGRALEPSIAVTRVQALFPTLSRPQDYSAVSAKDKIFTRESAILHLHELPSTEREALLPLLLENDSAKEKLKNLSLPVVNKHANVAPERADRLFGDNSFSPTRLEQFVACKFAYYCNRILKLRQEPTDTLDAAAVGTFIHYVLENTLCTITESGKDFADYTKDETDEIVEKSLVAYRDHLTEVGGGITPRAEGLLLRLGSLARIVVSSLMAEFADSDFKPAFFELDLSKAGQNTVSLSNDRRIPLSGKVDRVDYYRAQDGRIYLRVADYKTGRKTFKREDIQKGYCLQMPLYLLALCGGTHPTLAKELGLAPDTHFYPAGVTYLSTAVGNENTPSRTEKEVALENAASRLRRDGLLPDSEELLLAISKSKSTAILGSAQARKERLTSEEGFESLFAELTDTVSRIATEMKSGNATIAPTEQNGQTACKFCAYAAVCRAADKKG